MTLSCRGSYRTRPYGNPTREFTDGSFMAVRYVTYPSPSSLNFIRLLLRGENDSKQSDEFQAIVPEVFLEIFFTKERESREAARRVRNTWFFSLSPRSFAARSLFQGHPATFYCKITVWRSKYCLEISQGRPREYSSKPLKHIIVERTNFSIILKGRYSHIFFSQKFFICSDFLAESLVTRKL